MAFGSGFAAGAGADELQAVLKQKFDEALANRELAMKQQQLQQQGDFQRAQLQSLQDERTARGHQEAVDSAARIASVLSPGAALDAPSVGALNAGGLSALVRPGQTLDSTNYSGTTAPPPSLGTGTMPTSGPLRISGLVGSPNPGKPDGTQVFAGTATQQEKQHKDDALQALLADPKLTDEARMSLKYEDATGKNPPGALVKPPVQPASARMMNVAPGGTVFDPESQQPVFHAPDRPQAVPTVVIQTTDANGNPVSKIVPKTAGASYAKPAAPNATLSTRVAQAQTVNQVGDDLIAKLSDPKFASVVGPSMGRASKLGDWIGNPPPEFSELAGEIESYALANMGVHGMRSAQGAQILSQLMDQRHTPESMIATIRGINAFSKQFVQNNGPKGATSGPGEVHYDINGKIVK